MFAAGFCIAADDSDGEYFNVAPEEGFMVKTGDKLTYEASFFHESSTSGINVRFDAYLLDPSGEKVTGKVSPSTGTFYYNETKRLTVTAPDSAGDYTLVVEYNGTVTVEGEKVDVSGSNRALVKVMNPVVLKAEITNNGSVMLDSLTVEFVVDGQVIEGSKKTVEDIKPGETKSVTFDWVTDSLSPGKHTFMAVSETELINVSGLNSENVFYIGHNDYKTATIIMALLLVVLVFVLIYVYRKPVKNLGKPKGRR